MIELFSLFFRLYLCLVADIHDDDDQDECDDVMCSDIDDRASETDSKKEGSRGTSRGSSNESKSHGNSSKPRRYAANYFLKKNEQIKKYYNFIIQETKLDSIQFQN